MADTAIPWRIVEDYVYQTFRIFDIRRSKRINPRTNKPFDFFLMRGLDWVNVIPITKEGEVVLVKQYRHGSETYTIEIPGGCVEKEEDPAQSALRELEEETGYRGKSAELLGVIHPNPAMQAMRLHCYVARDVELVGPQSLDGGEDIEVLTRSLAQVREMLRSGEVSHALVVAALGLYLIREIKDL